MQHLTQFLNYCASNPDTIVCFPTSNMILHVESNASYLSKPGTCSCAISYSYLINHPQNMDDPDSPPLMMNRAIHVHSRIMRKVVSSTAKAEFGAFVHNGKDAYPICTMLQELGHLQPATPVVTNNSTTVGIATNSVKQRQSKAIDMRFYWIRDLVCQGQFKIYLQRRNTNQADYFSKHHPLAHHIEMRPKYLYKIAT